VVERQDSRMKSNAGPAGRLDKASRPTDAAGEHWRVGLASRCITPRTPLWLYGYISKRRFAPSTGVLDDLYARAVSLGTPDGGTAIILALDLCVVRRPLAERIVNGVSARTGVPPERILLNVSHTHSGPALAQEDVPGRFPMSADDYRRTQRYTEWMTEQAVAAAAESVDAMAPGRLSWASGRAGFVVNRRRLDEEGQWIGMGPAPDGPVDRDVPVLRIDDLEGKTARGGLRVCLSQRDPGRSEPAHQRRLCGICAPADRIGPARGDVRISGGMWRRCQFGASRRRRTGRARETTWPPSWR